MTEATELRWTGASKRAFLETFAGTGSVAQACKAAGKSRQAAYTLAQRAPEEAFRLGWAAAQMIARSAILDLLMERVVDGVEIVTTRDASDPERRVTTKRAYSHRIGLDLYARLDRMIERPLDWASSQSDAAMAARDFPGLLDLVEADATFEEARRFIVQTGKRLRAAKSRIQCQLAQDEVLGFDDEDHDPAYEGARKARQLSAWQNEEGVWRTDFPPPPGFDGEERGRFGERDYERDLAAEEMDANASFDAEDEAAFHVAAEAARREWFALGDAPAGAGPAPAFDRPPAGFDERQERSSALVSAALEAANDAASVCARPAKGM